MKHSILKKMALLLVGSLAFSTGAFALEAVFTSSGNFRLLGKDCQGCGTPLTELSFSQSTGVLAGKDTRYKGFTENRYYEFEVYPMYENSEFVQWLDVPTKRVIAVSLDRNLLLDEGEKLCPSNVGYCGKYEIDYTYYQKNRGDGNNYFDLNDVFLAGVQPIESFSLTIRTDEEGNFFANVPIEKLNTLVGNGRIGLKIVLSNAYFTQTIGDEKTLVRYVFGEDVRSFELAGSNFDILFPEISARSFISSDENGEHVISENPVLLKTENTDFVQFEINGSVGASYEIQQAYGDNPTNWEPIPNVNGFLTAEVVRTGKKITLQRSSENISDSYRHWYRIKMTTSNNKTYFSEAISFKRIYQVTFYDGSEKVEETKYVSAGSTDICPAPLNNKGDQIFIGWYTRDNLHFDCESSLLGDDVFYAKFMTNAHKMTFVDAEGKVLTSSYYEDGQIVHDPFVKPSSEKFHYIGKWQPEVKVATEDVTYTLIGIDSVLIDNRIDIKISNVADGEHPVVETVSKCIIAYPILSWDRTEYDMVYGDDDITQKIVFRANHKYSLGFNVELDVNNPNCSDDIYLKSILYQYREIRFSDFWINGIQSTGNIDIPKGEYVTTGNPGIDIVAGYSVKFFDENRSTILSSVTVASEEKISSYQNLQKDGYSLEGWYWGDADKNQKWDFNTPVTSNINLYGKWTINKYEIAVAANDSKMGSVKGAGTYEYGTEVELVATAAKGYKFSNWEDDVKASATRKVKVTAAASYKANFEKIPESSASAEKTSSSSTKLSSSSAKSSSSTKPKSSSSKTDAVVATTAVPQFSLSVAGRNLQIAGARIGSAYAILDMQGRVLATGRTASASMEIAVPRAGSYMVRVGSQTKRVNVK